MKKDGINPITISRYTGLDINTIQTLEIDL
jgi:hypothetical protein